MGSSAIIKLGLHVGRCISVTLNSRLDYYGTAANLAARLQAIAEPGQAVVSEMTRRLIGGTFNFDGESVDFSISAGEDGAHVGRYG